MTMRCRTTPQPSDDAGLDEWRAYAMTMKREYDTVVEHATIARKRSNRKAAIINRARRDLEEGNTREALDRLTKYTQAVDNDRTRRLEADRLRTAPPASEYELF